jgi:hypothetical protein
MKSGPVVLALVPLVSLAALVAFAAASLGCQSLDDGAKDNFSNQFSCPKAGVELRPRPEIDAYELIFGKPSKPPADVARDPARMAMWQKKQDDSHATWNATETVFELRGCGHQTLYTCTRAGKSGGHSGSVMCSDRDYPPGIVRW